MLSVRYCVLRVYKLIIPPSTILGLYERADSYLYCIKTTDSNRQKDRLKFFHSFPAKQILRTLHPKRNRYL